MSYTLTGIRSFASISSSGSTATATVSVASGDLVIFGIQCGTASTLTVSSITDNDTGNTSYSKVGSTSDSTNANQLHIWVKSANSSYTPTWTVNYSGVGGSSLGVFGIKVHSTALTNWTIDATFGTYTTSGNSSSTVMSWAPPVTDQANSVAIVQARVNGSVSYTDPAGWTGENGDCYAQMFTASGSSTSASTGTFNVASQWDVLVGVVYDAFIDTLTGQAVL